ncbi:hypothetical protein B0H14DRAFT_3524142 [Mycena olivaceomarginata]|nr:hypothetical protein B0H14DRAFT_3524142 [Mycena olivaceomarginata]
MAVQLGKLRRGLLRRTAFVERMRTITQVVVPREEEVTDWFGTVKNIVSTAGAVSAVTHPIVFPIVAGIGLSAIFINWLATVYKRTAAERADLDNHPIPPAWRLADIAEPHRLFLVTAAHQRPSKVAGIRRRPYFLRAYNSTFQEPMQRALDLI